MGRHNDAGELKSWREKLGVTQAEAARILTCSRQLIALVEIGLNGLVEVRRKRMAEALAAWEAGGMEAVAAMPEFRPVRRRQGRAPVPPEDAGTMKAWLQSTGFTRWEASDELALTVGSIRAIESGRMRISARVRAAMQGPA